ncbi:hypothetical protein E2320_007277, partial [Naja naja]
HSRDHTSRFVSPITCRGSDVTAGIRVTLFLRLLPPPPLKGPCLFGRRCCGGCLSEASSRPPWPLDTAWCKRDPGRAETEACTERQPAKRQREEPSGLAAASAYQASLLFSLTWGYGEVGPALSYANLSGSACLPAFFLFSGEAGKKDEEEEGKAKADPEDAIVLLLKKAKRFGLVSLPIYGARSVCRDRQGGQGTLNKRSPVFLFLCRDKLALAGYQFCILTLEEKVAKQKETPADALPEEERVNTHLLLAMSLDSYARYLLAHHETTLAQTMDERALKITLEVNGERHPQTVVVMNDLATALDTQGLYEEAYAQVSRAAELAQQTQHTDTHVILNNLAGILIHKGDYSQARQVYKTALEVAEKSGDGVAVRYIAKELAQLAKRKRMQSKAKTDAGKEGAEGPKE